MRLKVRGGRRLEGEARVPPDKSIGHRALILGALGKGRSRVHPVSSGADHRSTMSALRALGVLIHAEDGGIVVEGVEGPSGFSPPEGAIDCGNSGTTIRILTGVLAAAPHLAVTLDGDRSLRRRPMSRLRPLEAMGARLVPAEGGTSNPLTPPFTVHGAHLTGRAHALSVASAQVKTALLLAGLYAEGSTTVAEPGTSRDHTERMLLARGAILSREVSQQGVHSVSVQPLAEPWTCSDALVPPDISSATFLLAGAAITGGCVQVRTGVNPTRTGALDALSAMGVGIELSDPREEGGELVARLESRRNGPLAAHSIAGEVSVRAIDELPILAGTALFADGITVIADAAELRAKESDRILEVCRILQSFGATVEPRPDGLVVHGHHRGLRPARVSSAGDHRIAMTAAMVALGIPGESVVEDAEVIDVSFPGFVETLQGLGADVEYT